MGIADEETVGGPVVNGKMNELQSAYGLLQPNTIAKAIARRIARILTDLGRHATRDA